jgi:hypothetical protein
VHRGVLARFKADPSGWAPVHISSKARNDAVVDQRAQVLVLVLGALTLDRYHSALAEYMHQQPQTIEPP